MRFYTGQHQFYCGIDLHARTMYICILDQEGEIRLHKNLRTRADLFLKVTEPYRSDMVVAVECMFTWYWLADLCAAEEIPFVLGHALYMKAIHGGKAKNDRIDSRKIAVLLRGGMVPMAYVYPSEMRSTRDLLRRRNYLVQQSAALLSHIKQTNSQYNLPPLDKNLRAKGNRVGVAERFEDPSVHKNVEVDLALVDFYNEQIKDLELYISRTVQADDVECFNLLRTVPGIGKILALVMLYEIHDIGRFPRVQDFVSYCRLVKCAKVSAGKKQGTSGKKIGNAHLRWAFSEATCLFLRNNVDAQKYLARQEKKHGDGKALTVLAHKLARAVYYMLSGRATIDSHFRGHNRVVPVRIHAVSLQANLTHLIIGNLDPLLVSLLEQARPYAKSSLCSCRPDELQHALVADEGLSGPVVADEGKEAVLVHRL